MICYLNYVCYAPSTLISVIALDSYLKQYLCVQLS